MRKLAAVSWLALLLISVFPSHAAESRRSIPQPLPSHPGNIFLRGESVAIPAAAGLPERWQLLDYENNSVREGTGAAELGPLPTGYYEVLRSAPGATNRISLAVLEPLKAPVPDNSPIGSDVALAWLVQRDKMAAAANLCALAGLNWVRDRLNWAEMEPQKGQLSSSNRYDYSVGVQHEAGLKVLEVNHCSPGWANPNGKRFPLDLRDTYNFHKAIAQRWRGQVQAFEPWNEADISMFGGHTGSEMASLQKAAYLGLKAGNPKATACWNVFAIHRTATLTDVQDNEAWPYFDSYNLHHYEAFGGYPKLYGDHRAVSAGRPLWTSECSLPVKWAGDNKLREPTPDDLRVQSHRVAMTFGHALHERAEAVFYFVLPDYVEGQTQFGLLRADLTPRPAYVALAAAGRLLAGAQPLGKLQATNSALEGFVFDAKPDGRNARVLVLWSAQPASYALPCAPKGCFDHLGRNHPCVANTLQTGPAPLYVLLPPGTTLPLKPPPALPAKLPGKPSPLVLQALFPESSVVLEQSAYKVLAGSTNAVAIYLYNFGEKPARGEVRLNAAPGWRVEPAATTLELAPGDRRELTFQLAAPDSQDKSVTRLSLKGDFGTAGRPVLSLRLLPAAPKSESR